MKIIPMALAAAMMVPTAAQARHRHHSHYAGVREEICYKNVYREQYVPGSYGRPGYVRRWTQRQSVPCWSAGSYRGHHHRPYRQPTYHPRPRPHAQAPRVDDNSCIEGAVLGGLVGGAAGAGLSRGEGNFIGIPLGIVGGALIGCQIDGG
tara:strand:- start:778 stop:1227 length:450 start_codon:yes stop_codon:yes gene_type:complete